MAMLTGWKRDPEYLDGNASGDELTATTPRQTARDLMKARKKTGARERAGFSELSLINNSCRSGRLRGSPESMPRSAVVLQDTFAPPGAGTKIEPRLYPAENIMARSPRSS